MVNVHSPTAVFNQVQVRGKYIGLDGSAIDGSLTFAARATRLIDVPDLTIIIGRPKTANIDNQGNISVLLPATDDPDIGVSFTYAVTENFPGGETYDIAVPIAAEAAGLELATIGRTSAVTATDAALLVTKAQFDAYVASAGTGGGSGAATLTDVAGVVTASGALIVSKHNPVDATSGARTMTLANATAAGQFVSVEKTDASVNTVTVTGNLRGSASSVTLPWAHEAVLLASKADGSWWPIAGHKTKASLDAAYDAAGAASSAQTAAIAAAATDATNKVATETTRATTAEGLKLAKSANLSDLADAPTARNNLGVGTTAYDTRITRAIASAGLATDANYRGTWTTATAYAVGDIITWPGGTGTLVQCNTAHTSTSNVANTVQNGYAYDRNYWSNLPAPAALEASTTVPVNGLQTTNFPAAFGLPRLGLTMPHIRRFRPPAGRRCLVHFDSAAKVSTLVGTGSTVTADATSPFGYVDWYAPAGQSTITVPLPAATDITSASLRLVFNQQNTTGRGVNIDLSSDGAWTNYHTHQASYRPNDGTPYQRWTAVDFPSTEFAVAGGTGANLAAVTHVRFRQGSASLTGTDAHFWLDTLDLIPFPTDKAKVVIWLDDGGFAAHGTTIRNAINYGFPLALAYVAHNFSIAPIGTLNELTNLVRNHGFQIGVHAYGPNDHTRAQDGEGLRQQILEYHAFIRAAGLGIPDDIAIAGGMDDADTETQRWIFQQLASTARGTRADLPETLPPADPLRVRAMQLSGGTFTTNWKPYIQQAINCHGMAQFLFHDTASLQTEISNMFAWLDANRATVDVVTPEMAFAPYRQ